MTSSPLRVATGEPIVIDSSVAFKWFDTTEEGADFAAGLLRRHARDEVALIAPAHLALEVINALARRGVDPQALERAIGLLDDADLLVAPLDPELLVEAARLAHSERMALYDAVFVALAIRLEAELVTADRRQASTASCRVRFVG